MRSYISVLCHTFQHFTHNKSGVSAVVFALCAVPILLAAGGAIDFTRYYDARQNVQTALDAAVLAGAAADDPDASYDDTIAQKTFSSWNMAFSGTVGTPSFTPRSSDETEVTYPASVKVSLNMMVTNIIGLSQLNFTVTSTAVRNVTAGDTTGGGCVWFKTSGLLMNSGGNLSAPECNINNVAGSVMLNSGSTVTTPKLCISSSSSVTTNSGYSVVDSDGTSSLNKDCTTDAVPDLPTAPTFSCDNKVSASATYDSDVTLSPGAYCSGINFNSGSYTVTFAPGMYILSGAVFNFNSGTTIKGTGVTFYFADSSSYIQFNSGSVSTLSAPTSGDCEDTNSCGVLMYEASGLSRNSLAPFDSSTDSAWTGDVNMPSVYAQQNSNSYINLTGNLVLKGATINSSSLWSISPSTSSSSSSSYSTPHLTK